MDNMLSLLLNGMVITIKYKINKKQLSKQPIGCIVGSENDNGKYFYKNIVTGLIDDIPFLIRTNLSQGLWNKFTKGELSKQELDRYI